MHPQPAQLNARNPKSRRRLLIIFATFAVVCFLCWGYYRFYIRDPLNIDGEQTGPQWYRVMRFEQILKLHGRVPSKVLNVDYAGHFGHIPSNNIFGMGGTWKTAGIVHIEPGQADLWFIGLPKAGPHTTYELYWPTLHKWCEERSIPSNFSDCHSAKGLFGYPSWLINLGNDKLLFIVEFHTVWGKRTPPKDGRETDKLHTRKAAQKN